MTTFTTLPDYIEVLKEVTKNCDMETQTAVEQILRQQLALQSDRLKAELREKVEGMKKKPKYFNLVKDFARYETLDDVLSLVQTEET